GQIVVFGASRFADGMYHPFVARYTARGVLDSTFGGTGIVVVPQVSLASTSGGNSWGYPIAQASGVVQGDGRVVVEGKDAASNSADLGRLNLDGSLDAAFGTGGIAYEGGGYVSPNAPIALQPDGKFVLGGSGGNHVARFLSSGAPDTTFGINGVSATALV